MIDELISGVGKFSDDAYKDGWLFYTIIGLIILAVIIIFNII